MGQFVEIYTVHCSVIELDFDYPAVSKISLLTAVDLMASKLFLVDISSST